MNKFVNQIKESEHESVNLSASNDPISTGGRGSCMVRATKASAASEFGLCIRYSLS